MLLNRRKKITNRSSDDEIVDYKYCKIHTAEPYVVIDASYVFNRCSHDNYYNNLVVTACKLRYINEGCSVKDLKETLIDIMLKMNNLVYYPTVLTEEVDSIISDCYRLVPDDKLDYADLIVYGVDSEEDLCKSDSKVINYRTVEWKPSVAILIALTKEEEAYANSISDRVARHRYLAALSQKKKAMYFQPLIHKLKRSKIDSIVHETRIAMEAVCDSEYINANELYEQVVEVGTFRGIEISKYSFNKSMERLGETADVVYNSSVLNDNEIKKQHSLDKMLEAGYKIHNESDLITKPKVKKVSELAIATVYKNWKAHEKTFNKLNERLIQ